jgi:hypothetical protein
MPSPSLPHLSIPSILSVLLALLAPGGGIGDSRADCSNESTGVACTSDYLITHNPQPKLLFENRIASISYILISAVPGELRHEWSTSRPISAPSRTALDEQSTDCRVNDPVS